MSALDILWDLAGIEDERVKGSLKGSSSIPNPASKTLMQKKSSNPQPFPLGALHSTLNARRVVNAWEVMSSEI